MPVSEKQRARDLKTLKELNRNPKSDKESKIGKAKDTVDKDKKGIYQGQIDDSSKVFHSPVTKSNISNAQNYLADVNTGNKMPVFSNSYLKPNATFIGEQESDKGKYHVRVEFKTIDLVNSLMTGFLQISGLIENHPEITTFFKGEIINNPLCKYKWQTESKKRPSDTVIKNYAFATEKSQWGSYLSNDLEHWRRLTGLHLLNNEMLEQRLHDIQYNTETNDGCIYMRWKEEFLLPDSRVKQIKGASFEGFYYIVLNLSQSSRLPGAISGLYYHKDSDKFQSLNLKFVEDKGTSSKFDFV